LVRLIFYKDSKNGGASPEYIRAIFEGETPKLASEKNGKIDGFGRFISGERDYSFAGYMKSISQAGYGTGIFSKGGEFKYSGIFAEGADYTKPPKTQSVFTVFSDKAPPKPAPKP